MRAAPDDSFMFEHGQCVIAVPVWASTSTSRSSSQTAWAMTVDGPRMPRWYISSIGRRPYWRRHSSTSQIDSDEWVWMPVPNSSASAAAALNISGEQ